MEEVAKINEEENDGSFELGITKFSDLSKEEFKTMMGLIPLEEELNYNGTEPIEDEGEVNAQVQLPSSVDWRDENAVSAVRNQYSCGSCYAFSALSTIESLYYIRKGVRIDLSE